MMEIKRKLWLVFGVLVALHLLTAFAAIGLLTRMGPAIGHIINDNAASINAGQQMLAELARRDDHDSRQAAQDQRRRFAAALARARGNITEAIERPVLATIKQKYVAALAGEAAAREEVVTALLELEQINSAAMRRADLRAQGLSRAGAWAAALLAMFGLLLSTWAIRHIHDSLLLPLMELHAVLSAALQGDHLRRCRPLAAAHELRQILEQTNALLDQSGADHTASSLGSDT